MLKISFGRVVAVVAAVVWTGSCSVTAPEVKPIEQPTLSRPSETPVSSASPSEPSAPPSRTAGSWVPSPRPRTGELDLSTVRDCTALDRIPVERWQLKKGKPVAEWLGKTGTLVCTWAYRQPPYSLTVIVYQQSVYDGTIFSDAEPKEIEVGGLPAWSGARMRVRPTCEVVIDTHEGQHAVVDYNVTGPVEGRTVNCAVMPEIAADVITALR
ncbi:DUF3558 family protein [Kribbella sp. NPDC051137]|uniref:DUF3558 family protein n=1 Tax=Kribbella sp. NPDC051137 TaxID=3155045 RepID=UPI002F728515